MKLWILRPKDADSGPWSPWYDKAFGFVVRAESEGEARRLVSASGEAGDEGDRPWLSADLVSCAELSDSGDSGVILKDFKSA